MEEVFSSVIFIHAFLACRVPGPCGVGARERDHSDQSVAATAAAAQPRTEVSSSPPPVHKYRRRTEDTPDTPGGLRHPDTQKIFDTKKNISHLLKLKSLQK